MTARFDAQPAFTGHQTVAPPPGARSRPGLSQGPKGSVAGFDLRVSADGDGVIVLAADGDLDLATAPLLTESVNAALAGGAQQLVLDLSAVSFLDSSGLLAIHDAETSAAARGATLVLRRLSRQVWDLLSVTGLDNVFTIER